jgi:5-methylthioadenosine/S-adenosylhomocysteine deaminase
MLRIKNVLLPDFDTLTTTPGEVLIQDGRFVKFAPHIEADAEVVDAGGKLMLPGMTDTHTHMVQSLTKGPLDDMNITHWLCRMLRIQWSLNAEQWYYGVLLGCLEALRCGVTAINEMTYWPQIDAVAQAYTDSGIRATFGIGATDIAENDQVRQTPLEENLRQADYIYNTYHGKGRLRTSAAPQGRPACTPALMTALKRFAAERGLIFHTHLAEGRMETEKVRSWTGRGESEELAYLGVLDEHTVLAHVIWLSDGEIGQLAECGAYIAHCPSTNMKLSDGIPRIAQMLSAGCRVAFGCDGEASSANRDLIQEARQGSYLQKAYTLDPTVLPAQTCWKMLTETGAQALGYRDLGKLAEGFLADFSLVRTDDLFTTNRRRLLNNLLFAGSGRLVDDVYIAGEPVLREGNFLRHDLAALEKKCEEILLQIEEGLSDTDRRPG